jgi:2-polyprenyl-6-methoxyphenol hydroxylase-like FAD-dependent oxidoreductase
MLDFLIVGGGIGGAVLANLLAQCGRRVMVLEKGVQPAQQNRPEVLWPATVEFLRALIPSDLDEHWRLPIRGGVLTCQGRKLLEFGPDVFDAADVQPFSTANTRQLLAQRAVCEFRTGVEVTEVLHERGRVVGVRARDTAGGAEREILAAWTVGDDGAHSVIRQGCGLPMRLVHLPLELLGFSFAWHASLPANTVRFWLNKDRLRTRVLGMGSIPVPKGRGVALVPVWGAAFKDQNRLEASIRAFAAQEPLLNELLGEHRYPAEFTHFRLAWGPTPRFGVEGCLLMGDAAHPVTPAGGQGANASIADALAIAELASEKPDDLLAEYTRRRQAATQRSLSLSRGASRVLSMPRPLIDLGLLAMPCAIRWLNNHPERLGRFLQFAANAFREQT